LFQGGCHLDSTGSVRPVVERSPRDLRCKLLNPGTRGRIPAATALQKAQLTVEANNPTIHQGEPLPELTYAVTGFVNGDKPSTALTGKPILSTTAKSDSPPGTYPTVVKRGSLYAKNYKFKEVDGSITIVK
jgi:hypothetical protein